jgi:hypothetical protein
MCPALPSIPEWQLKNLDLIPLSTPSRVVMKTGLYALTLATAWRELKVIGTIRLMDWQAWH